MDKILGYCNHCSKFTEMVEVGKYYLCDEHKDLKQYQPKEKKKPKKIKPFSKKRAKENKTYNELRNVYLNENPLCECCNSVATEVHHKKGRVGDLLTNVKYFMAICRSCHTLVHTDHEFAIKNNYIIK